MYITILNSARFGFDNPYNSGLDLPLPIISGLDLTIAIIPGLDLTDPSLELAATKIQSVFKGFKTRKKLANRQ